MPPRKRTAPDSLSPEDLVTLADAVASGRRATVYIIEAVPSLGLPEGTSAKVVSIDGSTVTISPKGVDDELPYEAEELRIKRLSAAATKQALSKPAVAKQAATKPAVTKEPGSAEWTPSERASTPGSSTKPAATKLAAASTPGSPAKAAAASKPAASNTDHTQARPAPRTPAASGQTGTSVTSISPAVPRRAKKVPGGLSVTIFAGVDNDWSVTVTHGAKRPTKAQPVSPEAVGRAVRELGDPTARDAVESVISHARDEAARRVAELSKQLEEARTTLAALEQDV